MPVIRKTRLTTEKDCQATDVRCIMRSMNGNVDPDEPSYEELYAELMEEARTLLAAGEFTEAFAQALTACLIKPLDPAASGLMEEAGRKPESDVADTVDAVLAARREAIGLLVPGHPLSTPATLLPQQNPAVDMAGLVNEWKEAIRQAMEREAN